MDQSPTSTMSERAHIWLDLVKAYNPNGFSNDWRPEDLPDDFIVTSTAAHALRTWTEWLIDQYNLVENDDDDCGTYIESPYFRSHSFFHLEAARGELMGLSQTDAEVMAALLIPSYKEQYPNTFK